MQGTSLPARQRTTITAARAAIMLATLTALTACEEGGDFQLFQSAAPETSAPGTPASRSTKLIERDIEAPEVFQVTEAGLWDGRPSLGGVWVAHPDVQDPERVLIRNTANDNFVIGALFRRETMGPGPRLQVSSDAAAALGMLAGAPQQLNVTALRRETVDPEPAAPVDDAPGAPAKAGTPDPLADDARAALAETANGDAGDGAGTQDAAEAPERGGFFGWFRRKDETPSGTAAGAGAAAATTASTAAGAVQAETITEAPLDAPAPAAAPAPPAPSALDKPFVQLGIFSIEQNARDTATAMRQRALHPTVLTQESRGKTFHRVIVGPAQSEEERATILEVVRDAGFTDAYAVTN